MLEYHSINSRCAERWRDRLQFLHESCGTHRAVRERSLIKLLEITVGVRVSLVISRVDFASNAFPTDIEATCSSLWLRSIGRLATTGNSTQEACFRFHGTDCVCAARSRGYALETGQHALADRPAVHHFGLFSCIAAWT